MDDHSASPGGQATLKRGPSSLNTTNAIYATYGNNIHPLNSSLTSISPEYFLPSPEQGGLDGLSPAISQVRSLIDKVAATDASVLILGESGTGKEIAAHEIHNKSNRRDAAFVAVNCGAIPSELLESELFGHEKGAFTHAVISRPGRFELAEGGTLFLDEIGDMSPDMQVKLLRFLQSKTFERIGSNTTRVANVRIIAATHRNLEQRIKENKFREDLYYRLNVFPIEMPALRDRLEDLQILIHSMIRELRKSEKTVRISEQAISLLQQYNWPGNVRELANVVERLCILYPDEIIDENRLSVNIQSILPGLYMQPKEESSLIADGEKQPISVPDLLVKQLSIPEEGVQLKELLAQLEIHIIKQALDKTEGVVARAARLLGLGRTTLVEKLCKYDIERAV